MLILFSYPELFGVADNNGYGLKVFAYLKIAGLAFEHRHIFDASTAPRGQLPYIVDGDEVVGDSDAIIAHVARRHGADLDSGLSAAQRQLGLMLRRTLDDLYWVMSYSRWKDEAFWPAFSAALLAQHPSLTVEGLEKARSFNANRYYFQGIGRFEPRDAYARGIADLAAIASLIPEKGFPVRRSSDQRRCRDLWLHCQHLLLSHRNAAAPIRDGAPASLAPLQGHPCPRDVLTISAQSGKSAERSR